MVLTIMSKDASALQKAEASSSLIRYGSRAITPLLRVLSSPDVANSRFYAIYALGCLRSPDAVTPLSRLLGDRSYAPRRYAAIALGEIGDPGAVTALEQALNDVSYVRNDAINALIKIDSTKAREILESFYFSKSDPRFKLSIRCIPSNAGVGDAVEIKAAVKNVSRQDTVLRLVDGKPHSIIVVRCDDGAFVTSTGAAINNRDPARIENRMLKPGDTYHWAIAGKVNRMEVPVGTCTVQPRNMVSNAILFDNKAFLVANSGKFRIRIVASIADTQNEASPRKGAESGLKVVSSETSLHIH